MNRKIETHRIEATPEARDRLVNYYNDVVARRRAGDLADVSQFASRWCEQAARLALVLHAGLHGAQAHRHPLALETADNAVRLSSWFSDQQLSLLTKSRRAVAEKVETAVLELLETNRTRKHQDFVTTRDLHRNRIQPSPEACRSLLDRMERDGFLISEDITPPHGGKTTRSFRRNTNSVPE